MYIPVLTLNSWVISRPPNWTTNVKIFLLYLRPLIWGKRWASLEILESRKWLLAATFCKGSMQSEHNQNTLHWQWATVRLLQGGHWLTVGQAFKTLVRLYYQNGEVTEGPVGKWASSGPMLARNRPVKLLPLMTGMLEGASQPMRPNPTTERSFRNQSLLKLFTQTSGEKTHTPNCHQHKP